MMAKRDNRPATLSAEKGSALVMVIFIMVVLALLLAALAYINAQSNQNSAYQIASTRAYWAAQSGAEWGTYQIAPATGSAARRCFSSPAYPAIGSIPELKGCSAKVACSSARTASTTSYQITSQGACPAGNLGAGHSPVAAVRSVIVAISNASGGPDGQCVNCINNCLINYCLLLNNTYFCFRGLNGCLHHCGVNVDRCTSVQCLYNQCGGTSSAQSASLSYWLENP